MRKLSSSTRSAEATFTLSAASIYFDTTIAIHSPGSSSKYYMRAGTISNFDSVNPPTDFAAKPLLSLRRSLTALSVWLSFFSFLEQEMRSTRPMSSSAQRLPRERLKFLLRSALSPSKATVFLLRWCSWFKPLRHSGKIYPLTQCDPKELRLDSHPPLGALSCGAVTACWAMDACQELLHGICTELGAHNPPQVDPSGIEHLTAEEATELRFPLRWTPAVVARALRLPLYQLPTEIDVSFTYVLQVDDEDACAEEDDEDEFSMNLSWIYATVKYTPKVEIPAEAMGRRPIHTPTKLPVAGPAMEA
ncbi:hypothetical protein B0H19DRAFT_1070991 [Mycena capillaripes]|nr:hypothetical protein B0H19DRAFT_1070991 [Mycena capillaripes]